MQVVVLVAGIITHRRWLARRSLVSFHRSAIGVGRLYLFSLSPIFSSSSECVYSYSIAIVSLTAIPFIISTSRLYITCMLLSSGTQTTCRLFLCRNTSHSPRYAPPLLSSDPPPIPFPLPLDPSRHISGARARCITVSIRRKAEQKRAKDIFISTSVPGPRIVLWIGRGQVRGYYL